jgi:tRNA1Val (adenine37-N6)-methyltransferase
MQFSFVETSTEMSELVIEIERHQYTKEYIDLVGAYYLKM